MALTRTRSYQILDSDVKQSVRAATTGPVTLSGGAPNTIDTTVSLVTNDRVLVKDQASGSENGIYIVQTVGTGSNGTWIRATDFDSTSKVTSGLQVYVEDGTSNGDKIFGLITNNPITLGSTALTFSVLSSAGTATAAGSDTNVQYNSGGIFAGSNNFTFDGSNVDVAGYLDAGNLRIGANGNTIQSNNSNGNINLIPNGTGVILSNASVTAPTFISNIGSGTAPFTVSSTTRVANLNVAAAGISNTVVDSSQPNITSVGNLTIANIDNITIDGNTISSTNTNGNINLTPNGTGEIVAASLTVTDLAAGRLALVGTGGAITDAAAFTWSGTSVTVTGNIAGGNVNTAGAVVASTLTSNITTGTAPLIVTSTTQVANLNVATAGSATTAGTVTTAAQPNITSVGTLTSLGVNGTITGTQLISNITTGTAPLIVTSTTQVANLNVATAGTATTATTAGTVTTAAQPNITSVGTLTSLGVNGTITGTQLISNITTGTAPFTVTSTTQVANLNVATAGSATTAGTVTTAAQPNITSVGTLTILAVDNIQIDGNTISSTNTNGNIDISPNGTGNINLNDPVQGTSTIQATRFISNIATGTAPFTVTSTTQVANLNVATAGSATTAGTVTTAAQPNITSVGTLSSLTVSGDTTVGGNLTVNGTTTTINATELKVTDLNIVVAQGAGTAAAADGAGLTVGGANATLTYVNASNSWQFDRNTGANGTITGTQLISNITTGTAPMVVTSTTQVANLNVAASGTSVTAGTVTTAAQPNITSVGTLTILAVDNITIDGNTISSTNVNGNIDISPNGTGNINLNDPVQGTSTIQATRFISNIATGTAPFTVTSTTQVANLNVATAGTATTAGTVTTAAQPNITSVGTLTSLAVNGTITGTQLISNITTGTAPFTVTSTTQVANLNVATAGSATTAGTVTTAAQPNITSFGNVTTANIGTITSAAANGNVTVSPNGTGSIAVTATILPNANATYDLGSTSLRFSNVWGVSSSALYADLAEKYLSDYVYSVGTVLMIGGEAEVTIADSHTHSIVGVVSEKPAYLMNDIYNTENALSIAYIGRVPCRVVGKINRGDLLVVSNVPGVATSAKPVDVLPGQLIGKALENYNNDTEGLIEILVGRL